jgi:hypothetical protein
MGWLDVAVTALFVAFGVGLAAVLLIEGGSPLHAALALLLFLAAALRWTRQSFAGETLSRWWRRDRGSED